MAGGVDRQYDQIEWPRHTPLAGFATAHIEAGCEGTAYTMVNIQGLPYLRWGIRTDRNTLVRLTYSIDQVTVQKHIDLLHIGGAGNFGTSYDYPAPYDKLGYIVNCCPFVRITLINQSANNQTYLEFWACAFRGL